MGKKSENPLPVLARICGRWMPALVLAFLVSGCGAGRFLLPDPLREVSGLYYAGPDSLWWHNDSGDRARLFLTGARGLLREELPVLGALNRDWEDLTADKSGNLFIGDFGNNFNRRKDLTIYRYNPSSGALDSILFRYPDQTAFPPPAPQANFDAEAFFWYRDSLHLFSKNRIGEGNYHTKHYVIPDRPGSYTAELRDSLFLKKRVVTAAAMSPDGQAVGLLSYWFKPLLGIIPLTGTTVFILENFPGSRFLRGDIRRRSVPKFLAPTLYEALDFLDNHTVMVASERVVVFPQKARILRVKRRNAGRL